MKFRTVKQIQEYYFPKKEPKTGKEIAEELLEWFRAKRNSNSR